jgi:precorrin-2 C20-methyltransferase / precorrin-3B C17-methyltransferase
MTRGTLFGVGVGPGDPELLTLRAVRVIESAAVVAYPTARHGRSVARATAAPYLRPGQEELPLVYPVTTEETSHENGYDGALAEFYDEACARIAERLDRGLDVAVLCAGDPFLYGSYAHVHERLASRYPTVVVPGITSVSAAAAAAGRPLVRHDEVLTIAPGTLPAEVLAARLATADAAAVVKLGRTFSDAREAVRRAGHGSAALYVERASTGRERVEPLDAVEADGVPYFSLILVPSPNGGRERGPRGSVSVVGLGPAGPGWLTPEAHAELAAAEDLVGYGPYLDRVPARPGQRRHASDNREEAARARHALRLAAEGARVAVVSSGDPGIFAMAGAVVEALEEAGDGPAGVEVRVVPGLSAMQAAAARVGAPLGHDFCVISLSDRLKPWDLIARRLEAAAGADLAIVLYNPGSTARREQIGRARAILLRHRAPGTPVVVARDVGGAQEAVRVTTLGDPATTDVDMRTLLLVGSSTTRVVTRPGAAPMVYTPRRHPG